jgi:hypothetical protein
MKREDERLADIIEAVRTRAELLNQHDQIVLSLVAMNVIKLRKP